MVGGLFTPGTLPQTLDDMLAEMRATRGAIERLANVLGVQPDQPVEQQVRDFSIGSAGATANATYQTSEQMRIIGAVLTTDTLGRYGLTLANDASRWWRVNSYGILDLGFTPERRLIVPRGLTLTLSVPANANWDAIFWYVAGTAQGRST